MMDSKILAKFFNDNIQLNAQQMAHYLNVYGRNNMRQGIKNIYYDGLKKGGIIGLTITGAAAISAGIILIPKFIVTNNENKTLKEQNKELKQKLAANTIQGEV